MLVEDALRGVEVVRGFEGPIVDVGSGNGSPGLVLAAEPARPRGDAARLEPAQGRVPRARSGRDFPNVTVVRVRAEEHETDRFGVAVAKALAPPAVALEWVLPFVRDGGAAVLWLGPSADLDALSRVSKQLGGSTVKERGGLAVARKIAPTPAGFPRRPGVARKRPLA